MMMKKRSLALVAIVSLIYTLPVFADDNMGNMNMSKMDMAMPAAQAAAKPASKMAHGIGVVKGIDAKQGMVTLDHEAIKELNWPPMNMDFKVASPKLLKGLKVGQKVAFELKSEGGMNALVTAIKPAK
ncbi:copper-binding protein [Agitococcus lubricus]|nr:copper-binding protein [Agitococcus lubricus]